SIQNCDSKVRNELFKSICISGGTSMLNGFAERLNRELEILAPKTADINIIAPPDRQFSVWVGGSILASMKVFGDWLITKQEYKERGYAVVKQNCEIDKDDVIKKVYDTQSAVIDSQTPRRTDRWDQGEVVVYYYTSSSYQQSHFGN
ncbi:MAG: putative actin, partial [Streblomastix strix]